MGRELSVWYRWRRPPDFDTLNDAERAALSGIALQNATRALETKLRKAPLPGTRFLLVQEVSGQVVISSSDHVGLGNLPTEVTVGDYCFERSPLLDLQSCRARASEEQPDSASDQTSSGALMLPTQHPNHHELLKIAQARQMPFKTGDDLAALIRMIKASVPLDPLTLTVELYEEEIAHRVWVIQIC